MNMDDKIAKIEQSGATLFRGTGGNYVISNDITAIAWLLDIGLIDAIERGGRLARYRGKLK